MVFVLHTACEHISHSLEATVRVIRKSGNIIIGLILIVILLIFISVYIIDYYSTYVFRFEFVQ
jgi:hypothetical protein